MTCWAHEQAAAERRPVVLGSPEDNCHGAEIIEGQWWQTFNWADQPRRWRRFELATGRLAAARDRLAGLDSEPLVEPSRDEWDRTAARWEWLAARKRAAGSVKYWTDRVRAQRVPIADRMESCGARKLRMRCECGDRWVPEGCNQRMSCATCRERFYRKTRRRALAACEARMKESTAAWRAAGCPRGGRPAWTFITFTLRSVGDLEHRRALMQAAHEKVRKVLWRRVGKYPYFAAWEVTEGAEAAGHVHVHVLALWPRLDYAVVLRAYHRAVGCACGGVGEWVERDGKRKWRCTAPDDERPGWADVKSIGRSQRGAAQYIAKYATKGFSPGGFDPVLAARVVDAFHGKRLYTASRAFWVEVCGCAKCGVIVERLDIDWAIGIDEPRRFSVGVVGAWLYAPRELFPPPWLGGT